MLKLGRHYYTSGGFNLLDSLGKLKQLFTWNKIMKIMHSSSFPKLQPWKLLHKIQATLFGRVILKFIFFHISTLSMMGLTRAHLLKRKKHLMLHHGTLQSTQGLRAHIRVYSFLLFSFLDGALHYLQSEKAFHHVCNHEIYKDAKFRVEWLYKQAFVLKATRSTHTLLVQESVPSIDCHFWICGLIIQG